MLYTESIYYTITSVYSMMKRVISVKRDYLFDNLKVLLIFLVVFAHISENYINKDLYLKNLYIIIYIFHMPLFVFISGYFSKNVTNCREKSIKHLLIPFVFFNTIYYLYSYFIVGKTNFNVFEPGWTLWYLLSLFFWRFFLKDIIKLKRTIFILGTSLILGLLVGIIETNTYFLSFSRTFAFLPFFLLGYYANSNLIKKIKKIPPIVSSIGITLIGSGICILIKYFSLKYAILYLSTSYASLGLTIVQGVVIRIMFYASSALMCIFVINLIPISEYKISKLGEKTIVIYVGHIYLIFLIRNLIPIFKLNYINEIITIMASILIVLILSTPICEKIYNAFFENINKIIKINKAT